MPWLAGGQRFVPQDHAPGAEAEVDFGDVWVVLAGVKTRCHMFAFRLSHSGKAVHRVYPTQGQEAFLEGHIEAFNAIGGVPTRHIRYDDPAHILCSCQLRLAAIKQIQMAVGPSRFERSPNLALHFPR